ncbi:addiction module protein [Paraneptunicella aestuarii]|uniref:addiction module protein n=1 Tax=Paraneptunicella aestuarii TaxID=2831148 RepID=UPI001E62CB68|nr:addiction module protein [Paraneptunicella aestuarii]UAA37405.1 addiction module protein [Paraneptunicella aestuarii]
MKNQQSDIIDTALSLPSEARIELVERLLKSLDTPTSEFEDVWGKEVESRVDALNSGQLETVSAKDVLKKYAKKG